MNEPLPPVYCSLVGINGNAFALMGHWASCATRAHWPKSEIDRVLGEARSGDYNHLLVTLLKNSSDPLRDDDDDDGDDDEDGYDQ